MTSRILLLETLLMVVHNIPLHYTVEHNSMDIKSKPVALQTHLNSTDTSKFFDGLGCTGFTLGDHVLHPSNADELIQDGWNAQHCFSFSELGFWGSFDARCTIWKEFEYYGHVRFTVMNNYDDGE